VSQREGEEEEKESTARGKAANNVAVGARIKTPAQIKTSDLETLARERERASEPE